MVENIRVNGIVPGSIDTPMLRILPKETLDHFAQTVPMKRRGRAEEIANVITFPLSDEAPYVSGVIVPVDGGWLATSRATHAAAPDEIHSPGAAAFLQYDEHRRAADTHLGVPEGEVRDEPNGTDHRSHTEQDTAIATYVRWYNARADPKANFATIPPIRTWTDYPAEAA
ncbi:hypothetical protein TUSST3_55060 [Streptomyces sp. TUS-ST3]|uniref:SDR family oxidoreductase n=1 Tax=Streptomyces sp. TUS-ST3 TaxID=3025591 RepID=UPI00235B438A|nr:SDR family oxidoreductase [Streptomyces sp. TUS-ST3]GLP68883.1 hypothetical protein TUSST3_55060 [Streptomyces sp. TUS-ST3]